MPPPAAAVPPPSVEGEVRRLIRKEVVQGSALSAEEDDWLETTWGNPAYEALCDRIDDEVAQEKERLDVGVGGASPAVTPAAAPSPAAASGGSTSETPAAKGANRSAKERMIALNELLEAGLITPEEHARKRVDIIGKL